MPGPWTSVRSSRVASTACASTQRGPSAVAACRAGSWTPTASPAGAHRWGHRAGLPLGRHGKWRRGAPVFCHRAQSQRDNPEATSMVAPSNRRPSLPARVPISLPPPEMLAPSETPGVWMEPSTHHPTATTGHRESAGGDFTAKQSEAGHGWTAAALILHSWHRRGHPAPASSGPRAAGLSQAQEAKREEKSSNRRVHETDYAWVPGGGLRAEPRRTPTGEGLGRPGECGRHGARGGGGSDRGTQQAEVRAGTPPGITLRPTRALWGCHPALSPRKGPDGMAPGRSFQRVALCSCSPTPGTDCDADEAPGHWQRPPSSEPGDR